MHESDAQCAFSCAFVLPKHQGGGIMAVLRQCAFATVSAILSLGLITLSASAEVPEHTLPDVAAEVLPSVVAVAAFHNDSHTTEPITGSGFIIDRTGLIVTNKHVIDGATMIVVTLNDGTTMSAVLVGAAMLTDIALLRVFPDRPLPVAHFGDSDRLRVADTVIAIGNPLGFHGSVTVGVVSGLNRNIEESPFDEFIQTDAAINHGNSGGPLVNASGEVIGMNSVIVAPGYYGGSVGLGFAIPSDLVKFVTDQLREYGHMRPAWIGARFQQVTPQLGESLGLDHSSAGAIVLHTLPDSPAATAGLQPGDVVLAIDGQPIGDVRALARAIATTPIGDHLSMRIWRDSRQQTLDIVADMDPDNGSMAPDKSVAQPASAEKPIPLGLQLSDLTGTIRAAHHIASTKNGVLIDRVLPLSAAEDAGIQPGDVITRLEDCSKSSAIEITECLQGMSASGRRYVAILLQRDDTFRWVALRLSADGPR